MRRADSHAGGPEAPTGKPSRFQRLMKRAWWLHSFGALAFGVGVMLFARQGLEHADKVLTALGVSWLLVFIAFRFVVGAANTSPDERKVRKGVRLLTNYVIKQLYQQMFFFLVPLYASSATWSLTSYNWWLVPLLLVFAVLSTMDLVFDNFIMEHRIIAATMYGVCVFAVLNLNLPLVVPEMRHFDALLIAAGATAPTVALLTFRLKAVFSPGGLLLTVGVAAALVLAAYYGRFAVPPAPMAMAHGAIGHGTAGEYECVPGPVAEMRRDQTDDLRCVTEVTEPGGVREEIVHVWRHGGGIILRETPQPVPGCPPSVLRTVLGDRMPADPRGGWTCTAETGDGQLVGRVKWLVVEPPPASAPGD